MSEVNRLEVLLPVADAPPDSLPLAPRISSLRGKTVGFINNGWWSLGVTFQVFEDLLFERQDIAGIVTKFRRHEEPLSKPEFEDLVSKADAVICGLGN